MWVWHDPGPDPPFASRTLVSVPDAFEIVIDPAGRVSAAFLRPMRGFSDDPPSTRRVPKQAFAIEWDQAPPQPPTTPLSAATPGLPGRPEALRARTNGVITPRVWTLIVVTVERGPARLRVLAQSADGPMLEGVAASERWSGFAFPAAGEWVFGAPRRSATGFVGQIALAVLRNHVITRTDAQQIAASRRLLAPFDATTINAGGTMNGPAQARWMIGHSMPTFPFNGSGGSVFQRAAVVGRAVTTTNVTVYDTLFGGPPLWNVTRPARHARSTLFRGHSDGRYDGFFRRDLPGTGVGPGWVHAPAPSAFPKTRTLTTAPAGLVRIMTSSNSRAVKTFDGSGLSPGNYAHGFIEKFRAQTAGILMRPAILDGGGNPWFGFDAAAQSPRRAGPIEDIATTPSNLGDFARLFTGSGAAGRGPGAGVFLSPGASYALRCKPELGSLLTADAPLDVEAYTLAFPGAGTLRWRDETGPQQQPIADFGVWRDVPLDTTRHTASPRIGAPPADRILSFAGDLRGLVQVGDGCFVAAGPGAGSFSAVDAVSFEEGRTSVTLEAPFRGSVNDTSVLKFGPFEFRVIAHSFPPVPTGSPNIFRGLAFESPAGGPDPGAGFPIFAFSAVRPGVDGFAFGAAGWGGHGYQDQIDRSLSAGITGWMTLTRADVWWQVPAQQASTPIVMGDIASFVLGALPDCELVWAGESGLAAGLNAAWHQFILDQSAAAGVIGLSLLEHPRVGNVFEQYADGLLSDNDHYSQRGNRRLADLWIAQLRQALRRPCAADFDQSGDVSPDDLAAFNTAFDAGDMNADLNADDRLDQSDRSLFLDRFTAGC